VPSAAPRAFRDHLPADLDDRFHLRVEGTRLFLEGLDAVDGSPVLDIKPSVGEVAPWGEVRQPAWTTELMRGYWSRQ